MSDSTSPDILQKSVSRRDFLKFTGAMAATSILPLEPNLPTQSKSDIQFQESTGSDYELKENGLTEFTEMYRISQEFINKWGVIPPVFLHIQTALNQIVSDAPNDGELELLTATWGTKKKEIILDSLDKLGKSTLQFDSEIAGEEQQQLRQQLLQIYSNFPLLGIAAPLWIEYSNNGVLRCGTDAEGAQVRGCTDRKTHITLSELKDEEFAQTMIHELNHNFLDTVGTNFPILDYIDKSSISQYFIDTTHLLDQFLTQIAQDSSTNPADYTYGNGNWRDRNNIHQQRETCEQLLGIEKPEVTVIKLHNFTALPDDYQYSYMLRELVKAIHTNQTIGDTTARLNTTLTNILSQELAYIMHNLYTPRFNPKRNISSEPSTIIQQFENLVYSYQQAWIPLVSSENISGDIQIDELRTRLQLPSQKSLSP
ncbi:MAG TPA: twin-arginine translocation signal domain-containing protein [Candidatus Woesebacteria bacterium]|nr:twin-arginine translocation signal domain-containing protein [Candidatus Woesebacteria bacterium]